MYEKLKCSHLWDDDTVRCPDCKRCESCCGWDCETGRKQLEEFTARESRTKRVAKPSKDTATKKAKRLIVGILKNVGDDDLFTEEEFGEDAAKVHAAFHGIREKLSRESL